MWAGVCRIPKRTNREKPPVRGNTMKRWGLLTTIVLVIILIFNMQFIGNDPIIEINMDRVLQHTKHLSDESLQGRLTGTEGNQVALDYIESQLTDILSSSDRGLGQVSREIFRVPVQSFEEKPELHFVINNESNEIYDAEYGEDFEVINHPRSGNIDYDGELLLVSDSIYDIDPELLKGKVVVTKLNRVTNDFIDDLRERGAIGVLNMYTRSFDPTSTKIKSDTELNLRTDWKSGDQIFVGKISNAFYDLLKETAKENLIEEYSNLNPVQTSGSVSAKVTGYITGTRLRSVSKYPLIESENIVVKFPGKTGDKSAVIISSDMDGYGMEPSGEILTSAAQAMSSGILLEGVLSVVQSGQIPEQDVYFVFLNASKQGDAGMRHLLKSMDLDRRIEWLHIQNAGGVGNLPITYGDANSTDSDRQWAFQLRVQMHGNDVGIMGERGFPREYAPGFGDLISLDIPHVLISSGTDRYVAGNTYDELDYSKAEDISRLLTSFVNRDVLDNTQADYLSSNQIMACTLLISLAIVTYVFGKLAKENPGLQIFNKNIRFWTNTRSYRGISGMVYFMIPAGALILFMIFLLLFPKMFVTTDYFGLYSGYSPYLYGKRTMTFVNSLIENGFSFSQSGGVDLRILSSLVSGSFKLVIPAITLSICVGFIKGAIDSYKPTDGKSFISLALLSMPDVLVAFLGLQVIIMWSKNQTLVEWIPVENMRGIIMPVLALSIIPAIYISRLALIAVEEERHKGYVTGVLAKGATKWQTYVSHLLPVMMLKLLDAMPSVMKLLIANLIIVEYFYGYPGIANYLITHMDSVTLVLILSMGIGCMYLLLNAVFKALALIINPMKRRGI